MIGGRARPPRGRGRDGGQATVELALLLPVVVLVLLVILQIGLLGRDLLLVSHASREAARAAAVDPDPGAARAAARAAGGLDGGRLEVAVSGRGGPGSRVRVTVTYRAATDVPIIGGLLGDRTIESTTTMRVEGPARGHQPRAAHRVRANRTNQQVEPRFLHLPVVHGRIGGRRGEA